MAGAGAGVGSSVGGILGGVGVLAGLGGPGGDKQRAQALKVWQDLQTANFDMRAIPPADLKVFAQEFPQTYNAVIQGQPQQVQDSQQGRAAEIQGLGRFNQIAQEGMPTAERLAAEDAQHGLQQQYQANQESVLSDLAQRGRLSGGDEIAARMAGAQGSQNLAAQMGSNLAQQSAQNRMFGAQQAAQMGSQLRGEDVALSGQNANIMNRFNELASQMNTQAAQYNAGAAERAQAANVATRQHVGEANALGQYGTATENLNRQNALRQQGFNNQVTKTQGVSNALLQDAFARDQERRNKEQAIVGVGQGAGGLVGGLL